MLPPLAIGQACGPARDARVPEGIAQLVGQGEDPAALRCRVGQQTTKPGIGDDLGERLAEDQRGGATEQDAGVDSLDAECVETSAFRPVGEGGER
ncbi:hypothetical protein GCM10010193_40920 [Kitasatospora atroaurantiaca]|uniref:hypothetical protein n=1 Tax=Kitasatospora atroaurantiaca TaxID=285545 RepID=UPI0011A23150|nr:hypothetical protein [Kitasatospora atroaurantiaca]